MLAIERVPIYKNKLFLSTMSVLTGFVMTVGVIRAVNPPDTSTNQSALTGSDGRAASLIPINSSESESSSESGKSKGDTNAAAGAGAEVSSSQGSVSGSTTTRASASPSAGTTSTQIQSAQSASTSSNDQAPAKPTPDPVKPAETNPMCLVTLLNIGLVCS